MGLPVDDLFGILHDMLLKYDVHIIWGSIDTNRQSKYIRQINEFIHQNQYIPIPNPLS